MSDPLGLISGASGANNNPTQGLGNLNKTQQGPGFKAVLMDNLNTVTSLQADAGKAAEDLMTNKRTDVEGVIAATKKADTAFKMLQAMRNQVMEAYEVVKQMRV